MIKSALQSSLTNDIKYRSMSAGAVPSSEYLISSTVLDQSTPSVTFDVSGLGAIYKHLQLVAVTRVTAATTIRRSIVRFNNDSGANYNSHAIYAEGSGIYAGASGSQTDMFGFYGTGASSTAGAFGAGIIDILDPFETAKNTTIRIFGGQTGYNIMTLSSGAWRNTAALTSVTLLNESANDFAIGSRFSLYGVTA